MSLKYTDIRKKKDAVESHIFLHTDEKFKLKHIDETVLACDFIMTGSDWIYFDDSTITKDKKIRLIAPQPFHLIGFKCSMSWLDEL